MPGGATAPTNPIDWMTRDGKTSSLRATKAEWANPRFSRDGQKLALDISDCKQSDIWVYEWVLDTLTQLTFDPGQDSRPGNLYWVNADGTGEVTRLTDGPEDKRALDGKWRISTGGGLFPHWSATAHELLFLNQGKVMFAPYAVVSDSFRADKPQIWSQPSVTIWEDAAIPKSAQYVAFRPSSSAGPRLNAWDEAVSA